jgi:tetraacyldisaccharide 4'-kinase
MAGLNAIVERLKQRVVSAIRKTEAVPVFSFETVLLLLSFVYGGVMRLRARLYATGILPSRSLPCRVVSIGNITAGGTGKTPMTIFIARQFQKMGFRVAVISRGYRGRMEATGGIVSDGHSILVGPGEAGDEPYLIARILSGIPVLVGRRRHRIGMLAVKRFHPDVVILDDAFQHMALHRDLDLVLLDACFPLGNGHMLPRGLMREPPAALMRADAIVFTRGERRPTADLPVALPTHCPVFFTRHVPVVRDVNYPKDGPAFHHWDFDRLRGKTVLAFAGLADNQQFFDVLENAGCRVLDRISFGDHHPYAADDLERISRAANRTGVQIMVTTFKDFVKIQNRIDPVLPLVAVDVTIRIHGDPLLFRRFLNEAVGGNRRQAKSLWQYGIKNINSTVGQS